MMGFRATVDVGRHRDDSLSLGRRAARGTFITLIGQGGGLLVQMASVVVLARLLDPTAYGLVAMVLAVVGVAHIFRDFGLSSAAIQAPTLSRGQRSNLFWLNAATGAALTVVVFSVAPLVQTVYHAEHLTSITRVLSLIFVLSGAATQFRADLNRKMDYLRLALADIVSAVLALVVAVILALRGASYWALVAQQLIQSSTMLVLVALFAGWMPNRWRRDAPVTSFIRFGWNYVGAQLIDYAANNMDSFLIGYRFGAAPAGLYNRAFQLLARPLSQMRSPSITVALPTLSRLQDEGDRFNRYLIAGQIVLCYPITILMGLTAGASTPVVRFVLGPQWLGAEPILRFLTLAGVFQTLGFVALWVYLAKGITRDLRNFTILSAAVRMACIAAGLYWGVVGVAAGYGIGPIITWPLSILWLGRKIRLPIWALLVGGARIIVVGVVVTAVSWGCCAWASGLAPVLQILFATGSSLGACALLAFLVRPFRADCAQLFEVARAGIRLPA